MTTKVAVIVGSNSKDSINRKYAKALVKLAGDKAQFTFVDIGDLPMYNRDLEGKRPDAVNAFVEKMLGFDAYLILTPEHNRSLPAVLKNAIDWGSKPADKNVWNKPSVISGTSPGAIGTAAAQQHLRTILGNLGSVVMPGEVYLSFKPNMIDDSGTITMEDTQKYLQKFADKFTAFFDKQAA